ncbi:MFS transporter [Nocardiopsis sediminis]|uniref:MFS transporter n=1 Tax=Nocardiopsis sediminis TaxID=1778267 RepID=A0ABV8FX60_9ACTN
MRTDHRTARAIGTDEEGTAAPPRRGGALRRAAAGLRAGAAEFQAAGPLVRLLVSTQFAFNVGFFAVLPYLAVHLSGTLGLAGWLVGLVLGLRTFSQQGLFAVGGALTDRYGARPVVLTGCALRVAGFVGLAFAEGTAAVIGSVLLVGFAAALFSPAVETEASRQAVRIEQATGRPRTRVLSLFSAAGQAGTLVGPALGSLLLLGGFRAACLAGAAVFVLVWAAHLRLMPKSRPGPRAQGRSGPGGLVRAGFDRRFAGICVGYSAYLLAYNQLYLALPAEVERATGSQAALGWLLALASVCYLAVQMPLLGWAAGRFTRRGAIRFGLALIAAGLAGAGALLPLGAAGGLLPSIVFVLLLTAGQAVVVPMTRAWLPDLVDDRRLGLANGAVSSVSGLAVLIGGAPIGALLSIGGPAPWLCLAAVPLLGCLFVPRDH